MDIVLIQQNQHNQDWRQAPRVCLEDYTDTECIKKFRLNKDTIQVITNQFILLRLRNDVSLSKEGPMALSTQRH